MLGGLTVQKNCYQRVSNVLIGGHDEFKKKQTSWTYGLTLVPLGLGICRVNGLDVPMCLCKNFEGPDQHRGWFNSSLLTAVATTGKAPYNSVLTHGFVVDGEGRKCLNHG